MLELYHCKDARSFRVLWAMEELGLPYKLHVMPFPPRASTPDYLTLNPMGTIPFLVDGKTKLFESGAILEYLATRDGPTALAVKPGEADYGRWLSWIHYGEASLTYPQAVVLRFAHFEPPERKLPAAADAYTEVFFERLASVESELADREFLCAGRFTIADISVAYAIMLSRVLGFSAKWPPNVQAYWKRMSQREAFARAKAAQGSSKPG